MMLELKNGLTFEDLYQNLPKVDDAWLGFLNQHDSGLYHNLMLARSDSTALSAKEESNLIVSLSWLLEKFIAETFDIQAQVAELAKNHESLAPLYKCKRLFVQRDAARKYDANKIIDIDAVVNALPKFANELEFAQMVCAWMDAADEVNLAYAREYAIWALFNPDGIAKYKSGVLFKIPLKTDNQNLLPHLNKEGNTYTSKHLINRDGFKHTDAGYSLAQALDQANYCIHCHKQEKDSCSHGMKDAKENIFKVNDLQVTLAGCPLEEKISEMNQLKSEGSILGAFATITIDNPMVAGTGHRICNDCMKACIYQKQEPVNIPMIETQVLNDVLHLPWGFEIYALLTKWNPLNFANYLPRAATDHKVLVVGLGPAGYTLAHYLINQGFTVAAIDGLKIEPLPSELSGIDEFGVRKEFKPIYDIKKELYEELDKRKGYGFGGVAEYGITVRWDKNYLQVIRLLLERRASFRMYGGVRFGGNITVSDAWKLGFDHIALCMGAGKPNLLDMPNTLAKGVRTASDFLMTLQLSGAARSETIANLTLQLPVVVIGGGLTAIDSATESLAYYPIQVEKFLKRFEKIGESFFDKLTPEELALAKTFIEHGKILRSLPKEQHLSYLQKWGGVKVLYRKRLQDSPAYRLNHEEVEKALEEGIEFVENFTPTEIVLDAFKNIEKVLFEGGEVAAKTMIIAAGTNPNTVLATEDSQHFILDGKYFKAVDLNGEVQRPQRVSKPQKVEVITHIDEKLRAISFFGDQHPSFAGNVVKAMGSAKQGAPVIAKVLMQKQPESDVKAREFFQKLDGDLLAFVHHIERLTHNIIEVVIKAPWAAINFEPGQFYRMQNFEKYAKQTDDTIYAMEGLALTGAWVDKEQGLVSMIVLEMGGSSNLCKDLKVGEPIILMGPTGEPTHIAADETVVLVGGGLGNAVLFSIGKAFRKMGSKVIYFAGYKKAVDRYKIAEIEAASDVIVWCCDEEELSHNRAGDLSFKGNIIQAIAYYGALSDTALKLHDADRVIAIGSDGMMAAVAYARHNQLKHLFKNSHIGIASINSPMQCMMKEICGQCIQRHVDRNTGEESYVFSCLNQDQDMDKVDFKHLKARLTQNCLQEKLLNH